MNILDAPVYGQRDAPWAAEHLGYPNAARTSTIGRYGCAITAIGQKLTLLGFSTTPLQVQEQFMARMAFRTDLSRNLVDWPKVPKVYGQLRFNGRRDYAAKVPVPDAVMQMIFERLCRNDPVIVYVDAERYVGGLQQHFVLVIAESEGGGLLIANPWNGKVQDLRAYADTDRVAIRGVIFLDQNVDPSKVRG